MAWTLLLPPEVKQQISEILNLAKLNPFNAVQATNIHQIDPDRWKQHLHDFTMDMPVIDLLRSISLSYRVTYTQEIQATGLYHHIAISSNHPKYNPPSKDVIVLICGIFNLNELAEAFSKIMRQQRPKNLEAITKMWLETFNPERTAVNLLSPVK